MLLFIYREAVYLHSWSCFEPYSVFSRKESFQFAFVYSWGLKTGSEFFRFHFAVVFPMLYSAHSCFIAHSCVVLIVVLNESALCSCKEERMRASLGPDMTRISVSYSEDVAQRHQLPPNRYRLPMLNHLTLPLPLKLLPSVPRTIRLLYQWPPRRRSTMLNRLLLPLTLPPSAQEFSFLLFRNYWAGEECTECKKNPCDHIIVICLRVTITLTKWLKNGTKKICFKSCPPTRALRSHEKKYAWRLSST